MLNIASKSAPNHKGKQFILNVVYQKDFDVAIVLELLKQLGLNRPGLLDLFNQNYFRGNFVLSCVSQIRSQQGLLSDHLKRAKTLGQVTVPIMIDYFLLK